MQDTNTIAVTASTIPIDEIMRVGTVCKVEGNITWYKVPFYPGIVGICELEKK